MGGRGGGVLAPLGAAVLAAGGRGGGERRAVRPCAADAAELHGGAVLSLVALRGAVLALTPRGLFLGRGGEDFLLRPLCGVALPVADAGVGGGGEVADGVRLVAARGAGGHADTLGFVRAAEEKVGDKTAYSLQAWEGGAWFTIAAGVRAAGAQSGGRLATTAGGGVAHVARARPSRRRRRGAGGRSSGRTRGARAGGAHGARAARAAAARGEGALELRDADCMRRAARTPSARACARCRTSELRYERAGAGGAGGAAEALQGGACYHCPRGRAGFAAPVFSGAQPKTDLLVPGGCEAAFRACGEGSAAPCAGVLWDGGEMCATLSEEPLVTRSAGAPDASWRFFARAEGAGAEEEKGKVGAGRDRDGGGLTVGRAARRR